MERLGDVVKVTLTDVLSGGSHRRANTRRGALISFVSVAVSVLFAADALNEHGCDILFDQQFTDRRKWILIGKINRQVQLNSGRERDWGVSLILTPEQSPFWEYQLRLRCGECRSDSKRFCDATHTLIDLSNSYSIL